MCRVRRWATKEEEKKKNSQMEKDVVKIPKTSL